MCNVSPGGHDAFYEAQQETAAATASEADEANGVKAQEPLEWKANALRHSYASYRFAQTGDAGRVAGELGNSGPVVHRHYRELVKPAKAECWFNVKPETSANVLAQGEFMKGNQGEKGVASEARGATDWPVLLPVTGSKDCAALIELAARLVFGRLRVRLGQSSAFRLLA